MTTRTERGSNVEVKLGRAKSCLSRMALEWVGSVVSIDCGGILGAYQGVISQVDGVHQTISLIKAYRNGFECKVPEITICAQDILGLKILKSQAEISQGNGDHGTNQYYDKHFVSCHPEELKDHKNEERRRTQSVSDVRRKSTTPKRIEVRRKWQEKDDACFSAPVDSFILENDFDFEKNLALFDKQAVFEEINATSKPDIVRLVDTNRRPQKYRCDEHVLEHEQVVLRQITVPMPDKVEFVTDSGLIVPSIQKELRNRLFAAAEKHGFSGVRLLELFGRGASEMALQLLGGSHRLNPQNAHQKPLVVILCGPHFQGLQGLNCGRHLSNHGAKVVLYFPNVSKWTSMLTSELSLYTLSDGKQVSSTEDLPSGMVDLVICAYDDHETSHHLKDAVWHQQAINWARQSRAPLLALDPPVKGASVSPRWSVVPALPLGLEAAGSLYLCDVGIPTKVFSEIGIQYCSPFGSKFVIPLHTKCV